MFNTIYGWYLKEELSCVFDTVTFTKTLAGHTHADLSIVDAVYGDAKKTKLGTFNFIITRIFSASHAPMEIEAEILPDGDLLQGFVSIIYLQREVEPETPIVLTMDLQVGLTNSTGAGTDVFMVFEGFWIPRSLMDKFSDFCDMVVTSPAKIDAGTQETLDALEDVYNVIRDGGGEGGAGGAGMPSGGGRMPSGGGRMPSRRARYTDKQVPFCKRRRF